MRLTDLYHMWRAKIVEHFNMLTPPDTPEDYDWDDLELQAERDRLLAFYFIIFSVLISIIIFMVALRGIR